MRLPSSFKRDKRANVATFAAFLAVPLLFALGAGVDVSRAWAARAQLQGAVDSAALSVMKVAAFKPAEAERHARRMIEANFDGEFSALQVRFSDTGATVSARTSVGLTMTKVLGFHDLDAQVSGTAEYPPTKYEIALILDTTASMSGAKLAEMKKGAQGLVEELTETEFLKRNVRFSVVPFSDFVNVGADKADADWIDKDGAVELPGNMIPAGVSRLDVFENFGQTWKGCVETRFSAKGASYGLDDTPPDAGVPDTLFVPLVAPDEPTPPPGSRYRYGNDYVRDSSLNGLGVILTWNGVLQRLVGGLSEDDDDDDDDDADDEHHDGDDQQLAHHPEAATDPVRPRPGVAARGPGGSCNVRPIRPLTADHASVTRSIAALTASGGTNLVEGVAWGNRVLSPGQPFAEGQAYDADVKKIMVVLTDGDNEISRAGNPNLSTYSSFGYLADGRWDGSAATTSEPTGCYLPDDIMDPAARTPRPRKVKVDRDGKRRKDPSDPTPVNCVARPADLPMPKSRPSGAEVSDAMDDMTRQACSAAKKDGVEVFTIRLMTTTATSSRLLQDCATDGSYFYDVSNAAGLRAVFDDLANRIKVLRISS